MLVLPYRIVEIRRVKHDKAQSQLDRIQKNTIEKIRPWPRSRKYTGYYDERPPPSQASPAIILGRISRRRKYLAIISHLELRKVCYPADRQLVGQPLQIYS